MMPEPDLAMVQRAITIAQNATDDNLDSEIREILQVTFHGICRRIQAAPNSYILTDLQARVFNYHQAQWRDNDLARRAMARYWSNTSRTNGAGGP